MIVNRQRRVPVALHPLQQFYERARREGWGVNEIDSSHNPHITCPDLLAALLDGIAR